MGPAAFAQPAAPTTAAPQAMRSRVLTSLTGYEIGDYLKRNDVIFIPVGPTEINGGNPVDIEYVVPLAYAIKLAEKSDGLVFPNLSYFDPGSTNVHPATVQVSASEGIAYLKVVVRSLIRQGFRRIVFISAHGPAFHTIVPAADEIFYETHVPSVWLEPGQIAGGKGGPPLPAPGARPADPAAAMAARARRTYGAYRIAGRLNDMPVGLTEPPHDFQKNEGLAKISSIIGVWNGKVPGFFADGSEHGGWVGPVIAAQRDQWGAEGEAAIAAEVKGFDITGLLDGLRDHAAFTRQQEARLGGRLPGAKSSVNVKP